jgi:hypothetical protein
MSLCEFYPGSNRLHRSTGAFKSKGHQVEFVKDGVAGTLPSAMNCPTGSSIEYVPSSERKRIKKTKDRVENCTKTGVHSKRALVEDCFSSGL